jgi:hypothetical protein
MIMSWTMFIIFLIILSVIIKWLRNELSEAKNARVKAELDRREMLQAIKVIETEVTDLHKVLHPIEKRHFR